MDFAYLWGDALDELERAGTDVRIINLETSITTSADYWRYKPVLYRMHPQNIGCLTAARIDCCALANNHVLDWGEQGLLDTLRTLDAAGIARAGVVLNAAEAAAATALKVAGKGRVLVCSLGSPTSGVPWEWAATGNRPGLNLLKDLSAATAQRVVGQLLSQARPNDVTVASIHWGGNWGYHVPAEQIEFAHRLIDAGVSIVHGHSSHHPKAIEVYRERPIFYGCGDFLTDYEGITGYEEYRGDLVLMYLVRFDAQANRLRELRLTPLQIRRFRLRPASEADAQWLGALLSRIGAPFGTQALLAEGNRLNLRWW